MKIGNPADYYVQVVRSGQNEDPGLAALLDGVVTMHLNMTLSIVFVPDVSPAAPPWLPVRKEIPTTVLEARVLWANSAICAVTPNAVHAGGTDTYDDTIVFYVAPEEFAQFAADLAGLTDDGTRTSPFWRRDQVGDRAVIQYLDERLLPALPPEIVSFDNEAPA